VIKGLDEGILSMKVGRKQQLYIPGKETQVCKLKRAHYGLKQSPKAWYSSIDAQICAQGLQRSNADNNLYFTHATNGRIAILLLYGNDIYLTGDYAEKINII
jgi:hypothetical protein